MCHRGSLRFANQACFRASSRIGSTSPDCKAVQTTPGGVACCRTTCSRRATTSGWRRRRNFWVYFCKRAAPQSKEICFCGAAGATFGFSFAEEQRRRRKFSVSVAPQQAQSLQDRSATVGLTVHQYRQCLQRCREQPREPTDRTRASAVGGGIHW